MKAQLPSRAWNGGIRYLIVLDRGASPVARIFGCGAVAFLWTALMPVCAYGADAPALASVAGAPLTIITGGTYEGTWRSTGDDVPAVKIVTRNLS